MIDFIETIRTAMQPDANDESRASGAAACRAILAALEAHAGQPRTSAPGENAPIDAPSA